MAPPCWCTNAPIEPQITVSTTGHTITSNQRCQPRFCTYPWRRITARTRCQSNPSVVVGGASAVIDSFPVLGREMQEHLFEVGLTEPLGHLQRGAVGHDLAV